MTMPCLVALRSAALAAAVSLSAAAAPAAADILVNTNSPDDQVLQVSEDGSSVTTLLGPADGIDDPTTMAYDGAGNLFIASQDNRTIYKRTPAGTLTVYASGITTLRNMTVSSAGEVYITETFTGNSIQRVNPDGTFTTFAAGSGAGSIIFDAAGDLIYSVGTEVYRLDLGTDTSTLLADIGVSGDIGDFAFDAAGNLYGALTVPNKVVEIGLDGTITDFITTHLSDPAGLLFEDSGTVLVTSFVKPNGTLRRFDSDGNFIETVVSGLYQPKDIVILQDGPRETPQVPEPGTLILLATGLAAGLRLRRKRRGH